jgi:uncharacterized membrane protein YedE/YeeE
MKYLLMALISGIIFGAGLVISGMTDTNKIIGFLNIFDSFDYDLAFVMGAAVITTTIGFQWMKSWNKPVLAKYFYLPTNNIIDRKLIVGSALFGIGWGLVGYCPAPALISMLYGNYLTIVFVGAMIIGMFITKIVDFKTK